MWHNANLSRNVAFVRNDSHATRSTAGWRLITFTCGMPACVTPRGTSHSPKGSLVRIRTFVKFCFGTYLWHASLRHPAGNIPFPEGEPCTYTYICEILFVLKLTCRMPACVTRRGTSHSPKGSLARIRTFVKFCFVLELISSYEHF